MAHVPSKEQPKQDVEDTIGEAIMKDFVMEGDDITLEVTDVKEIRGVTLTEGQPIVKLIKFTGGRNDSMLIPVELEGGIGGAVGQDLEWQALYEDLSSLDDEPPSPPRENDPTWE